MICIWVNGVVSGGMWGREVRLVDLLKLFGEVVWLVLDYSSLSLRNVISFLQYRLKIITDSMRISGGLTKITANFTRISCGFWLFAVDSTRSKGGFSMITDGFRRFRDKLYKVFFQGYQRRTERFFNMQTQTFAGQILFLKDSTIVL